MLGFCDNNSIYGNLNSYLSLLWETYIQEPFLASAKRILLQLSAQLFQLQLTL